MTRRSPRLIVVFFSVLALALGALWVRAQQADTRPLASLLPPGALLYLEAKDLHSLVAQWNSSDEKKKWLASDNFGILSRSRLVQRLGEAQDQFATVAGVPVEFNLLNEIAGAQSAFAFYDLPNLQFVYLTKVDSSRLNTSELWRSRTKYQQRQAAGISFFVNVDLTTHRTIALASYQGWFVISSAEAQMAQVLALLSGSHAPSLATASWFADISGRAPAPGDLRLVYHLDALLPTPQFRTYWLQQNTSELKSFASGLADLFERKDGFEEQRVLLRQTPQSGQSAAVSLAPVLRYAPQLSSLYRAWSLPDRDRLATVLEQVVLGESAQAPASDRLAPQISTQVSEAGSPSDYETRIDQPPFRRGHDESVAGLVAAVATMQPVALLHVQSTADLADGVFVLPQSGVVIECREPSAAALEKSLHAVAGILQTGSLDPLQSSVVGNLVILTRLPLASSEEVPALAPGVTYAALFNKRFEWPHYRQLFALIDRSAVSPEAIPAQNAPTFFTGNLGGLGDLLSSLDRASIITRDTADELRETVQYSWSAP